MRCLWFSSLLCVINVCRWKCAACAFDANRWPFYSSLFLKRKFLSFALLQILRLYIDHWPCKYAILSDCCSFLFNSRFPEMVHRDGFSEMVSEINGRQSNLSTCQCCLWASKQDCKANTYNFFSIVTDSKWYLIFHSNHFVIVSLLKN